MLRKLFLSMAILLGAYSSAQTNLLKGANFEKDAAAFATQTYWAGKLERLEDPKQAHKGKACLHLTPTSARNTIFGRILCLSGIKEPAGMKYSFKIWAKGKGMLHIGAIKYAAPEPPRKEPYIYDWQEKGTELTDKWQEISYLIDVSTTPASSMRLIVELRGEGEAFLDDASLTLITDPNAKIDPLQKYAINPINSTPQIKFQTSAPGKMTFVMLSDEENKFNACLTLTSDDKGIVTVPPEKIPSAIPSAIKITAACNGASATTFASFVTKEDFHKSLAIAKKINATKSFHILYFGDSLTDFARGHNFADKVDFWLNLAKPGQESFHNAGVGGDFITRMEDRLAGRKAHRAYMYDGVFHTPADIIFIFLGHNDTKASSTHDFKIPTVTPETQKLSYEKVLDMIRAKSNAKIVLLSASSSVEEICRVNTERRVKDGKTASFFGIPKYLEAFNETVKLICSQQKLDYLDVYTPTKNYPDKPTLFNKNDGVHLSEKGHAFIADLILNYLANHPLQP